MTRLPVSSSWPGRNAGFARRLAVVWSGAHPTALAWPLAEKRQKYSRPGLRFGTSTCTGVALRRDRGLRAARHDAGDRLVAGQLRHDRDTGPSPADGRARRARFGSRRTMLSGCRFARGDAGHERIRPARQRRGTRAEQAAGRERDGSGATGGEQVAPGDASGHRPPSTFDYAPQGRRRGMLSCRHSVNRQSPYGIAAPSLASGLCSPVLVALGRRAREQKCRSSVG